MKKLFSFFLSLVVSAGTIFAESGTCGDNLTWDLTNGVLTISGIGDMTNFQNSSSSPWYSYRSSIIELSIENNVTSIGKFAFANCKGLTSIIIPNSVTNIGEFAFAGCSGLTNVTIPNSVTSIGEFAFAACSGLTSPVYNAHVFAYLQPSYSGAYTILNGIESIAGGAFDGCSGLTNVTIPNSVISIGRSAFDGCSGLTNLEVESGNTIYDSRDNCNAIIETTSNTLIAGCKNTTIPNSVTRIGEGAFISCSGMMSVTIPNSVTSIGDYAFQWCSGLTSITCEAATPPTCDSYSVFYEVDKSIPLYVPYASIDAYKAANQWKEFTNIQAIPGTEVEEPCLLASGTCGAEGDNLTWKISCEGVLTISGSGNMTNWSSYVIVPWNAYRENITSLTISTSVTSIGGHAFWYCSGLTSVTIPNSVTSIGDGAFAYCSGLTSIEIPSSVTSIGREAFEGCWGLTSVVIPNSVTSIGSSAFSGCSGLTSITIPNSVTSIGEGAFFACSGLTSIEIPNSVISIGRYAFCNCSNLTSVTIPNSVTSIGYGAFYQCYGLTSVTIGNSVISIGRSAFEGCSGLTSIEIPNSVISIGRYAFYNCSGLASITCKADVPPTCEDEAFDEVNKSIPVYVPEESIEAYKAADVWKEFTDIQSFPDTEVEEPCILASGICGAQGDNLTWELSCEGVLTISGTGSMADWDWGSSPWYDNQEKILSIVIETGVTSIGKYAFVYCRSLTSVVISNSVTSIGNSAFRACSSLTSIDIPNSVTSIGNFAFFECTGLTNPVYNVHIFAYLPTFYFGAYSIPDGIEQVAGAAFYGCSGLTNVTIPNSVTSIGDYAFCNCSLLTSIEIPNSVKSIGGAAFISCSGLASIIIPNSVTSIGEGAYSHCSSLKSIVVENDNSVYDSRNNCNAIIETISNTLISGCKNTIIPNSVTSIGGDAFNFCSGLTNVTIPNSVTNIGIAAFMQCVDLVSIEIPNSVTSIGRQAFQYCSSLTSIEIPESVTSMGQSAFSSCSGLTSITNRAKAPQTINSYDFDYVDKSIPLYVPYASVAAYQSAIGWKDFANILPISSTEPCLIASGTCGAEGDNLSWELSCDSVLTISGTGAMANWSHPSYVPWYAYRENITNVIIGNSVTSIGNYAFWSYSGLTSVTVGNSVTSIGNNAFNGCTGLTTVTIGNSVTSIGNNAFNFCSGLTNVTCKADVPPTCEDETFYEVDKSIPLYVPAGSIEAYKAADVWKEFTNIQAILEPEIPSWNGECTVTYVDKDEAFLGSEEIVLHVPEAPEFEGFTFIKWIACSDDLQEGITIQAIYEYNGITTDAPTEVVNPANPAQKLIRNGNVYILTKDRTYSITGQEVK